jgi:hypothetical protein
VSRVEGYLDPRVEKFVANTLKLADDWDSAEVMGSTGLRSYIASKIYRLDEELKSANRALAQIGAEAVRAQTSTDQDYWPSLLIGGGSWFTQSVERYNEKAAAAMALREQIMELVMLARAEKILPLPAE